MTHQSVLLIGATSTIARAMAKQLAQQGHRLHLAARSQDELQRIAQDLEIRYQVTVSWSRFEAQAYESHPELLQQALHSLGQLDGVIVSIGELGNQDLAQTEFSHAQAILESNYTGVVSVLTPIANYLEQQQRGFIVALSSVAGDRGRQSNYVYGSAKGALSLFLQGLRNRLATANVQVLTVKPGFVDTQMTFGKPGMFLVAQPDAAAVAILAAVHRKQSILYVPWFWFWIMGIIRAIPETIFMKLKL